VFDSKVRAPRSRTKYDDLYNVTPVLDKEINDTRRRSHAGNQSYKLDPKNEFDNQGLSHLKKNKKSALDSKREKEQAKANSGNAPGNRNNHSSNAARAIRVAEGNRGGVTPESYPKILNEEVPPTIERMGGHQPLEPPSPKSVPHTQIESISCSK